MSFFFFFLFFFFFCFFFFENHRSLWKVIHIVTLSVLLCYYSPILLTLEHLFTFFTVNYFLFLLFIVFFFFFSLPIPVLFLFIFWGLLLLDLIYKLIFIMQKRTQSEVCVSADIYLDRDLCLTV